MGSKKMEGNGQGTVEKGTHTSRQAIEDVKKDICKAF
jgi:hypothetical protein